MKILPIKSFYLYICLLVLSFTTINAQERGAYKNETPEIKAERMKWYTDARFGMFIHWGVYSQLDGEYKGKKQKDPKGEWIMRNLKIPVDEYVKNVACKFNPTKFNADKWVKAAADAGMKYIVITTKHHDGFAMFKSETSRYNIVDTTAFKRDVIKEIADACGKYGLKFGVYYSQAQDWYHPGGLAPKNRWDPKQEGDWSEYFRTIVKGQVTELFTNYGDISLIWWDSGRAVQNKDVADEVALELVKLQPDIIVNPRLGGHLKGDFNTFEQVIPGILSKKYNELCLTHNRSWSYKPSDTEWKSPEFILKTLVHMASIGGNFLFNVGPKPTGEFPEQTYTTLKYIADWMKINSEAIYGTQASPFYKLDFGKATLKTVNGKNIIYLFVYNWPQNQELTVSGLKNKIKKAYVLGDKTHQLKTINEKNQLIIKKLPKQTPHDAVSVIALELKRDVDVDPGYIKPEEDKFVLTPLNALLTIKPQYDYIPEIKGSGKNAYFDNWRNHFPHPRFKNTGNAAHWIIDVSKAGNYNVRIVAATRTNSNVITVSAKQKLKTTLPDTGGMEVFKEIDLGQLKLKKGLNTITFTGGNKTEIWDYVRLKRIILAQGN